MNWKRGIFRTWLVASLTLGWFFAQEMYRSKMDGYLYTLDKADMPGWIDWWAPFAIGSASWGALIGLGILVAWFLVAGFQANKRRAK